MERAYERMAKTNVSRYAYHFAGIIGCSVIAWLIWCVAAGIALSPIINRPDDAPRTEEAFTGFEKFCGFIADGMGYPFLWIPPHALSSTQTFILFAVFWGCILYLFLCGGFWLIRNVLSRPK
jgi:hypothetical protein